VVHALSFALIAVAVLAVFFWIGLVYWVNKDARRRIRRPLLVIGATVVGLVPAIGPLVYLLLRPAETRAEVRSRDAELAALEAQITREQATCPACSAAVDADFVVCPVCTTRLRERCAGCDAALERLWQMCPYCATPVEAKIDLDAVLTREARSVAPLDRAAEPVKA